MAEERGGYTVHPVPSPLSTIALAKRRVKDGGSIQNLQLLVEGMPYLGLLA